MWVRVFRHVAPLGFMEFKGQSMVGFETPNCSLAFSWRQISGHSGTLWDHFPACYRASMQRLLETSECYLIGVAVLMPWSFMRLCPSHSSWVLKMRKTPIEYVRLFLRSLLLQSWKTNRVIHSGIGKQETGKRKEGWDAADRGTLRTPSKVFRKVQPWKTMNHLLENKGYLGVLLWALC